ncbi:MAG: phosphonate ABC transporter ATP-binding protein [Proteobacteria bacterium]|nr:phosphonate ABC transporter ATP-binding protein [Pseudomonadota bacterium]
MTTDLVIDAKSVSKCYVRGVAVLDDVSLSLKRGEMVALIGASGSGKSTLIRSIAGLIPIDKPSANGADKASAARIHVLGQPIQSGGRINCSRSLRARIGVIFQQFNLVPRLSLLTNVCFGLLGRLPTARGTLGRFSDDEKRIAMQALARVGIAEHALRRANDLSGGQQQRAAIARSLVQGAELLIADEPIASLDPASSRRVMDLLADMNRNDGLTVLVSLHQVEYAMKYCPRTIALKDGKVAYDGPSSALTPAFLNRIYGAESEELFLPSFDAGTVDDDLPPLPPRKSAFEIERMSA